MYNAYRSKVDYRKDPEWADWPFWDEYGNPMPDPKELESFIDGPDLGEFLDQIDAEVTKEEQIKQRTYRQRRKPYDT